MVGIECAGNIFAGTGETLQAVSGGDRAGVICYGTLLDEGADINAEIDAVDGVREQAPD